MAIAYQEALSCDVPVFAWDAGGPWRDPNYFPHRVNYAPVTSVPYWDDRCGMKFADFTGFEKEWPEFFARCLRSEFNPRQYILDNLTLEQRARQYYEIAQGIMQQR